MRAIVLTSTFLRHQFVVNYLASRLNVVGVWQEEKSFYPLSFARNEDEKNIIEEHFAARDAAEQEYFGQHQNLQLSGDTLLRRLAPGEINNSGEAEQMLKMEPTVVLVFGTGILRGQIIDLFDGNMINIHLGLSPYYRGSGTNFWPLVNREPEYVGATIHYLDAGIDTGAILAHVRPTLKLKDGSHDIGNKAIQVAAQTLAEAALAHTAHGPLQGVHQISRGKLYQRKDFNAGAIRRLQRNFETGMIEDYLSKKSERDSHLELVSLSI